MRENRFKIIGQSGQTGTALAPLQGRHRAKAGEPKQQLTTARPNCACRRRNTGTTGPSCKRCVQLNPTVYDNEN